MKDDLRSAIESVRNLLSSQSMHAASIVTMCGGAHDKNTVRRAMLFLLDRGEVKMMDNGFLTLDSGGGKR